MLKGKSPRLQVNCIEGIIYDTSKVAHAKLSGQHNLRDQQQGKERACAAKRTTLRQSQGKYRKTVTLRHFVTLTRA